MKALRQGGLPAAPLASHDDFEPFAEALAPGVRNIIGYLDTDEVLESVPILAGKPTSVRWTSESIETVAHDGAVVERAVFDAALLRLAVARGVEVLLPASLAQVDGAPGSWCLLGVRGMQSAPLGIHGPIGRRHRCATAPSAHRIAGCRFR